MRRILIVINSSRLSGAEASIITQIKFLRESSELVVALPSYSALKQRFEGDGYRVITIDMVRFSKRRTFGRHLHHFFQILRQSAHLSQIIASEKIDIVWANSLQSLIYVFPIRFITKAKVIWSVRDNISNKWKGYLFSLFATQVICISEYIRSQLPSNKKNKVIYNGVDLDLWKPEAINCNVRILKRKEASTVHIGNIGQLIPWKNQLHFISIAIIISRFIPNAHFFIIGEDLFNDYPEYRRELEKKVIEADMADSITFLGHNDDIKSIINDLDIIIHTALNEPLGRVILEAMALKRIVFSYASGGIKEIIEDGKDGFLGPENDPIALANRIVWFFNQSLDFKEGIKIKARRKILSKFDAHSITLQIKAVMY